MIIFPLNVNISSVSSWTCLPAKA